MMFGTQDPNKGPGDYKHQINMSNITVYNIELCLILYLYNKTTYKMKHVNKTIIMINMSSLLK